MSIKNVEIPYGAYWSTPFTKWQGHFTVPSFNEVCRARCETRVSETRN